MRYVASSRESVSRLAMRLSQVRSADERAAILAVAEELRLFRAPALLRVASWLAARVSGRSPTAWLYEMLRRLAPKNQAVLDDMWEQLVRHCLRGHDREDDDSVGGWSQRELDRLCSRVKFKEDEGGLDDVAVE